MINFHDLNTSLNLKGKKEIKDWLNKVAKLEGKTIGQLDIIFCTDNFLLDLNKKYLNHDYFTDIITFNYADNQGIIRGDLYISVDRVNDNSLKFETKPDEEMKRVMVHGLLHLIGYNDMTEAEQKLIRKKEDHYLGL